MGPWGSAIVCVAIAALCVVVLLEEPATTPHVPDAKRGEEVFRREAMCLTCHQLAGRGGQNGPPLDGVATKFTKLKGGREQARNFFYNHIVDPVNNPGTEKQFYPFTQMPSFLNALGEEKIHDVCEYLLTLE